ncbi:16S rRNA m(7)G-527 methyltransferase [Microbacteriaceae bacterium MWH-Ta3]|nr:16S rRNA m(7)G-527 methyltransferase [Microbacteriaceae bacterium MWH-Ta3]
MKHIDVETEPAYAEALFGVEIERARRFADNLAREGEERGLIGPDEPARLWTRHLVNCVLLAPELGESGTEHPLRVADIGSGAGLPGLVLAIARPDIDFTLIEPLERRTRWLSEQVEDLELDNVVVFTGRAEDFPQKRTFDVVTARAVKALKTLIPMIAPLVDHGGSIKLLKGARIDEEIEAATAQITRFALTDISAQVLGEGLVPEPTRMFSATVN